MTANYKIKPPINQVYKGRYTWRHFFLKTRTKERYERGVIEPVAYHLGNVFALFARLGVFLKNIAKPEHKTQQYLTTGL